MVTKLESSPMQMGFSFIKFRSNLSVLTITDVVLLLLNGDPLSISSGLRKTAPVPEQKTGGWGCTCFSALSCNDPIPKYFFCL